MILVRHPFSLYLKHLSLTAMFSYGLFAQNDGRSIFAVTESVETGEKHRLSYSGRINAWFLYETDDFKSTQAAIVYDTSVTPAAPLGIAVGRDVAIECVKPNRSCEYRDLSSSDLKTPLTTQGGSSVSYLSQTDAGDSLLSSVGMNVRATQGAFGAHVNGNLTTSLMENRTLYSGDKYRFRFTDAYASYHRERYRFTAGRKAVEGDVLIDGITGDYFFGPDTSPDSKSVGLFAGLAPNPITKHPSTDSVTFGGTFRYIPNFSGQSDTKFQLNASLVAETFKGSMDRFYLFSRAHFTPVRSLSLLAYSTLELPWTDDGSNAEFKSSHFSLQSFWRPKPQWFVSLGFSQFRIDRHLQEQAVQWVVDPGSRQAERIGETLDRSQRYRGDVRLSYRPIPMVQPFIRARYERRTFDSNKTFNNSSPPTTDLGLVDQKDAYSSTFGFRLNLLESLETESSYSYNRRYSSKGYDLFQSAVWDSGKDWTVDAFFQYVSSERTQNNSVFGTAGIMVKTTDYYTGVGGSYRFLSDFLGQIRYDFSGEDDPALSNRFFIHTVIGRIDYSF